MKSKPQSSSELSPKSALTRALIISILALIPDISSADNIPVNASNSIRTRIWGEISGKQASQWVQSKCGTPFGHLIFTGGEVQGRLSNKEIEGFNQQEIRVLLNDPDGQVESLRVINGLIAPEYGNKPKNVPPNTPLHTIKHRKKGNEHDFITVACSPNQDPNYPIVPGMTKLNGFDFPVLDSKGRKKIDRLALDHAVLKSEIIKKCREPFALLGLGVGSSTQEAEKSARESLDDPIYYTEEWGAQGRPANTKPKNVPFIAIRGKTRAGNSAAIAVQCLSRKKIK